MAGLRKRMTDELRRQLGVRITSRFERKYRTHAIQIAGHREATLGLPGPELRAYVLNHSGLTAALTGKPCEAEFIGQSQIQPGIIY